MSYDFMLLALDSDADLRMVLSIREQSISPSLFNDATRQLCQSIAEALKFKNPGLDWRPFGTSDREYIEVDDRDNGDGIQISLRPNAAGVTVAYWHTGQRAYEVFRQLWDYLRIIQQMTTFAIYDTQLDR